MYHFLNKFLSLLVLPTWNKSHFLDYQFQLVSMMLYRDSVKYAVLASCAANKYTLSNDTRYQNYALVFYSRAVKGVNNAVVQLHSDQTAPDDSLLATVVFLYLHDVCCSSTIICTYRLPNADNPPSCLALGSRQGCGPATACRWRDEVAQPAIP